MLVYLVAVGLLTNLATACLDCPPSNEGDRGGKLILGPFPDEDTNLKTIAMTSRGLVGLGGGLQQKAHLYQKLMGLQQQQQQHHQRSPSSSSPSSSFLSGGGGVAPANNLLQVYTLLNKGISGTEPRFVLGDYFLQDPLLSRISKKAEKGMLVDVMDYVSKSDDRNRRVGQNMRSSG